MTIVSFLPARARVVSKKASALSVDLAAVETAPACRQCGRLCDSSVVSVLQHSVRALTPTPDSVNRILYLERPAACKKVCTFYNTI